MHTRFEALWVSNRESAAEAAEKIEAEVRRLEAIFNRFDAGSEVAALNRSREKVKVISEDLWFLLELSEQMRAGTQGYFDIAAQSALRAGEARFTLYHASHEIKLSKGCVLDFGGIAKGYALERVRKILCENYGVQNALLNFGGSSVLGIGHHPLGPCWLVAAEGSLPEGRNTRGSVAGGPPAEAGGGVSPKGELPTGGFPSAATGAFELCDCALSVSGLTRGGRNHIINPRTGRAPAREGNVAVQGKSAIVCEALSTALYAAEPEVRNEIIANFDGYRCGYCAKKDAQYPQKRGKNEDTVQ